MREHGRGRVVAVAAAAVRFFFCVPFPCVKSPTRGTGGEEQAATPLNQERRHACTHTRLHALVRGDVPRRSGAPPGARKREKSEKVERRATPPSTPLFCSAPPLSRPCSPSPSPPRPPPPGRQPAGPPHWSAGRPWPAPRARSRPPRPSCRRWRWRTRSRRRPTVRFFYFFPSRSLGPLANLGAARRLSRPRAPSRDQTGLSPGPQATPRPDQGVPAPIAAGLTPRIAGPRARRAA